MYNATDTALPGNISQLQQERDSQKFNSKTALSQLGSSSSTRSPGIDSCTKALSAASQTLPLLARDLDLCSGGPLMGLISLTLCPRVRPLYRIGLDCSPRQLGEWVQMREMKQAAAALQQQPGQAKAHGGGQGRLRRA